MRFAAIAIAVTLVCQMAGCFDRSEDEPPSGESSLAVLRMGSDGCIDYMCRLDPQSLEAQQVRDETGLEQLTNKHANHVFIQVQDGWVVWLSTNATLSHTRGDIWAMNLTTRDLYGVRVGPGHSIRPFLDDGRVVFQYDSGLMEWRVGSDTLQPIDVGLQGRYWLWDVEGDWIAIGVGANISAVGEWAVNTKTGQRHRLYTPPPNGSSDREVVNNVDLSDTDAYYVLARYAGETSEFWLHRINLTSGTTLVYPIPQQSNSVIASNTRVLVSSFPEFLIFNLESQTFSGSGFPQDASATKCYLLGFGTWDMEDWVTLKCNEAHEQWYRFYHLTDGKIVSEKAPSRPSISSAITDGQTIAYIAAVNGLELYTKPVPSD